MADEANPPTGGVTMYSTTWCGYCTRLKAQMDRAGVKYSVIDIEHDDLAAEWVAQANGGNRTVPTLRFSDGSALTNPSLIEVQARLLQLEQASQ